MVSVLYKRNMTIVGLILLVMSYSLFSVKEKALFLHLLQNLNIFQISVFFFLTAMCVA